MGTHDLSLREGVEEIYKESFRVAGGQSLTLSLDAKAESQGAEASPPSSSPEKAASPPTKRPTPSLRIVKAEMNVPAPRKKRRVWTWISLGIGAAAGISGGVIGGIAMSKEKRLKNQCDGDLCPIDQKNEGESVGRMAVAADVLYGVAAVGAVTGLVLFFVEPKKSEERRVSASPSVLPSGAGVWLRGDF
jgi:hypothetical protein